MSDSLNAQTNCHKCPLRKMDIFRPLDDRELKFVEGFKTGELTVDAGSTILLEENKTQILGESRSITFDVRPYQIVTLRLIPA